MIQDIRNIAVIAHIDAGKTTLTERMLYYSGLIHKVGEVHYGTTTTDYLQEERDRGITIVSSVIQLSWSNCMINLIDTPGHLDFNPEVEKSLCVLEGAVIVIDASQGVEPQTECVWVQANKYNVARIVFVNKMDKVNADFSASVKSLNNRLSSNCIPISCPLFHNGEFYGFFDLVSAEKYTWVGKSHDYSVSGYDKFSDSEKVAFDSARAEMLDAISSRSDLILEKIIEEQDISYEVLLSEIARLVKDLQMFPVLCGSAFHNKGVQIVLDYVCKLLPSPDKYHCDVIDLNDDNKELMVQHNDKGLVAFVFKVVFDSYSGYVAYTRIYCGSISVGDYVYNSRSQKKVRVQSIIRFQAASNKQIECSYSGDVIGLVCDDLVTADTLSDPGNSFRISKITVPDSVVEISITPKTKEDQDKFGKYIHIFMREDPTIKLRFDPESRSTCLNGVGSLQLEILLSRMLRQFDVALEASKPRITYRETITKDTRVDYLLKKQTGGAGRYAGVTILVSKCDKEFEFIDRITKGAIPRQYIPEIIRGCKDALCAGVITKSPVINIRIELIDGKYHPVDSSNVAYYSAARAAVHEALLQAECIVLEPINSITLYSSNEYLSKVIGSIYSKRGSILSVTKDSDRGDEFKIIEALMPMEYIFDYADEIRGLTKGTTAFVYKFHSYRASNASTVSS